MYLRTLPHWRHLEIRAVADLDPARARAQAVKHGVPRACSVEDLLADPTIELVINLTPPAAHASVGLAVLDAGKALFNEKPLAVTRADGRRLVEAAAVRGLALGGAPETFLGRALRVARDAFDRRAIGEPVGVAAFSTRAGPEPWHPNPAFFYQAGGGPLFDLGVYHLATMVSFLGPVARVTGAARATFGERTIGSGPLAGQSFPVETPTHVSAQLEFASGVPGLLYVTFDVAASRLPHIELYGADGTLDLVDPTMFVRRRTSRIRLRDSPRWEPLRAPREPAWQSERGLAVAEMAFAMRAGREPRASGRLAFHVLDIMCAIYESADAGRTIELESSCERPPALEPGWPAGEPDG
jgi:predicted dehydrogenase